MRVAMYYSNSDIRMEEMPKPDISSGELLVRIEASGICGSDVLEWYRINKVPLVLGHEIAGQVTEVGEGIKNYKIGDRISASHHVPCNDCHYCLSGHETVCDTLRKTNFYPGGFSEYIKLPRINVEKGTYLLPDEVSYEEATFIEPLACVIRGQKSTQPLKDKGVLILGSGISGILHIQLARHYGAKLVIATDINEWRLKQAKKFGANFVLNAKNNLPTLVKELNAGKLADFVVITTKAQSACEQALKSVDRGGSVLFFAATQKDVKIPLAVNEVFWRNEVTLTSSYAATPLQHLEALGLIRSKKINVKDMITHRLKLDETQKGFQLVSEAKESLKVIIQPQR